MKKIVGIFLVFIMVLGSFSTALAGENPAPEKNLKAEAVLKEAGGQTGSADPITAEEAAQALRGATDASDEIAVYVATDGDDGANAGTMEAPFASVERARSVVRVLLETAQKPINVYVREGKYFFEQPVVFEAADSGTASAPVTYRPYDGERVVLSGAKTLQKPDDTPLDWQPYKENIYVADVQAGLGVDQLYIDGKKQIMGRYPNYDASQTLQGSTSQANIKARSANWADPAGAYIRAIHQSAWGGNSFVVTGKDANNALGLKYTWVGDNNRGAGINNDVLVENLLEEVDSPLEWYYDNENGKLYVYPESGVDLASAHIEGAVTDELLKFTGEKGGRSVTGITIDGFELSKTKRTMFTGNYIPLMRGDWCVVRAGAVFLQDAENLTIQNCTIEEIGGNGIFISGHNSGHVIDNNEILHLGSTGILIAGLPESVREPSFWNVKVLDGKPMPEADPYYVHKTSITDSTPGPRAEHYPKDITISKNHIMDVGIFEKQSCGVSMSVAHNIKVLQNTIHESPRAGINVNDGSFGGHEIAYNDIFDCQKETADHGQFNSWGRDRFWSLGGFDTNGNNGKNKYPVSTLDVIDTIKIHDNRWYHDGKTHTWGIDLDDGSSNYEIYNNLCLNMGIKLREGFGRTVYNNIIVNGEFNIHCTFEDAHDQIYGNIVLQNAPYQFAGTNKLATSQNVVDKNWVYDFGTKISWPGNWESLGFDQNAITDNPQFKDPRSNDYTVTNEAAMEKVGFENFSMTQFGKPGCAYKAPIFAKTSSGGGGGNLVMREQWLGATITAVYNEAIQSATGTSDFDGVYFENVPEDSIAAQYGFKTNDIIKTVNGSKLGYKDTFMPVYDKIPSGGVVSMEIYRDQLPMTINYIRAEKTAYTNNTSKDIVYGGTWVDTGKVDHAKESYDGDLHYNQSGPAGTTYFEMAFTGNQIQYMTRTENNMGSVKITITDSAGKVMEEKTVDCTSAKRTSRAVVYTSASLPYGQYKIRTEKVNGEYFILDALIVTSVDEQVEQVTSGPLTVKNKDSLVDKLEDAQQLSISVPVHNQSAKPFEGEIAVVFYDIDGAKQCLFVARERFALEAGASERYAVSATVPEGADTKRLAILLYEGETMRPIALPYVVDGRNVALSQPAMQLGTNEIEYYYEKDSRTLYAGLKGLARNAQAMMTARGQDVRVYDQATVDANGQVVFALKVEEGFAGEIDMTIGDEFGMTKTKKIQLDASVSTPNKAALRALLDADAKTAAENKDNYTFETWLAFEIAYRNALAVDASANATQAMIESAVGTLSDALEGLLDANASSQSVTGNNKDWVSIFRADGTPDGGAKDTAGTNDQWQRRSSGVLQVDTTKKGAYAEIKGAFASFKLFGAAKSDSADFIIEVLDGKGVPVSTQNVTNPRNLGAGTHLLYENKDMDGQYCTIRIKHNGTDGRQYMELHRMEFVLAPQAHPGVESIDMASAPYVAEYLIGSDMDVLGAAIKVVYDDATEATIPVSPNMVTGYERDKAGRQVLNVTYAEKKTTFEVVVRDPSAEQLAAANEAIAKLADYQRADAISTENRENVNALIVAAQTAVEDYLKLGDVSVDQLTNYAYIAGAQAAVALFEARDALQSLYAAMELLDAQDYTQSSWKAMQTALDAAKAALEDGATGIEQVKRAHDALVSAQSGLKQRADSATLAMLQMFVEMYASFEENGYTPESWAPFRAAMDAANALIMNPADAGADETANAMNALIGAGNGLVPISVDTSVLVQLIAEAEKELQNEALYIPKAVAALRTAIQESKDLLANVLPPTLTQDMVQAQSQKLIDALSALWEKGDKKQLEMLVNTAGMMQEALFTQGTWAVLVPALDDARTVIADVNATEPDVKAAYDALDAAIRQLKPRANKVALATAINLANAINANIGLYAPASVTGLKTALDKANAVYNNTEATQAEVDAAKNALMEQVSMARLKANKSALKAAVLAAGNVDGALYTPASMSRLRAAVAPASAMLENENATQQSVDGLTAEIYAALDRLERVQNTGGETTDNPAPDNGTTGGNQQTGGQTNGGQGPTQNQTGAGGRTTPNLNGELVVPATIDSTPDEAGANQGGAGQEAAQPEGVPANGADEEIDENQVPLAGGEEETPAAQNNAVDSWLLIILILAGSAVAGLTVYFVCKTYQARTR